MDKKELLITTCPVCGESKPDAFRIYFDGYIKLFRCRTCSHVTQFPGPGGNTMVDQYDDYYELDFVKNGQEFIYQWRNGDVVDMAKIVRKLVGPGKKILHIASGHGHFLHFCEQEGFDCTGVEPSKALSEYSRTKVPTGKMITGYYTKDMFPAESFDVISLIQVVEHLFNPLELLEFAKYHLKPGGLILIEVPSRLSPHFLAYWFTRIKWFVRPPAGIIDCHISYFTPKTMELLTKKAGFTKQSLVTGRWKVKYNGLLKALAYITDPIMNALRIGGILYIGRKD